MLTANTAYMPTQYLRNLHQLAYNYLNTTSNSARLPYNNSFPYSMPHLPHITHTNNNTQHTSIYVPLISKSPPTKDKIHIAHLRITTTITDYEHPCLIQK